MVLNLALLDIQTISATHKQQLHQSKYYLLQLKLESLSKTYEQELLNKEQILSTMPVKLNQKNASEKVASKAVEQALKELEQFYRICNTEGNNGQQLAEAKYHLWSKMRQTFANIPNVLLFNAIMRIKEEQLQQVMQLNKSSQNIETISSLSKPMLNSFDIKLLKTKAELMGLVAKYLTALNEVAQLEERFAAAYSTFMDELQRKVNNFNGISSDEQDESSEEIISEFILQYNLRNFNHARNEYLSEQIEQLRAELESGVRQLESHELLLCSIKQIYGEISTSINGIRHDMMQLSQIKEKILYSKNILKNMLDDMQATTHQQNAKSQLFSSKLKVGNMSYLGMESFSLANDSVFSSTKLEFDASPMESKFCRSFDNTTIMPGNCTSTPMLPPASSSPSTLPSHLLELNTFAEMPLEKLSCVPRNW